MTLSKEILIDCVFVIFPTETVWFQNSTGQTLNVKKDLFFKIMEDFFHENTH